MSDDARRILLSRRARFLAAAIASIGTASAEGCKPMVCLEPAPPAEDASADAEAGTRTNEGGVTALDAGGELPQSCLSQTPPDPDASDRK